MAEELERLAARVERLEQTVQGIIETIKRLQPLIEELSEYTIHVHSLVVEVMAAKLEAKNQPAN